MSGGPRAQVAAGVTAVIAALGTVTGAYGVEAGLLALVFAVVATAMIALVVAAADGRPK